MAACAAALNLTEDQLPDGYIGYQFQNVSIAFIVLGTVFVALRFFARYRAGTPWSADDIFLPLALIANYGLCGVSLAMVHTAGVGRHTLWLCVKWPMALIMYAKLQIPFTILQAFAIAFAKLAILYMFLRIFVQPIYRWATYGLMGIVVGTCIAVTILTCTVCTPIQYLWEPQLHPDGHCIDINAFWRWGSFPQIVTDVAILILPLPALWQLNLPRKDRIGVIVTFCIGSIGLITSIVRFVFFWEIDSQSDGAWVASRLGCVSIAESSIYIIAACLPVYRTLLRTTRSRAGTGYSYPTKRSYGSGGSKGTELRSIGKSEKGFERFDDDMGTVVSSAPYQPGKLSEEQLVSPGGRTEIKVQRNFYITTTRQEV